MRIKFIIPITVFIILFSFALACNGSNVAENKVETTESIPKEESVEEIYHNEMSRISRGVVNSTTEYYKACDDFINLDISLEEHKEATRTFVRRILVLYNSYEKLIPPKYMVEVHDLFGSGMDHFNTGAEYLKLYIESDNSDDMSSYLAKATSEVELAAKYLNQATSKINSIYKD
jgi:hypothetical protein